MIEQGPTNITYFIGIATDIGLIQSSVIDDSIVINEDLGSATYTQISKQLLMLVDCGLVQVPLCKHCLTITDDPSVSETHDP